MTAPVSALHAKAKLRTMFAAASGSWKDGVAHLLADALPAYVTPAVYFDTIEDILDALDGDDMSLGRLDIVVAPDLRRIFENDHDLEGDLIAVFEDVAGELFGPDFRHELAALADEESD